MQNFREMRLVSVLMVLVMLLTVTAAAEGQASSANAELAHGIALQLPDGMVHAQITGAAPSAEIFSMRVGEDEIPLYRIDFGNENAGELLGMLWTEAGDIPVTFKVFAFSEEEIAALDDAAREDYYALMENLNDVLDAVSADPRFTAGSALNLGEVREAAMKYWTVALPERITWVESEEDGGYQAVFYGSIHGENAELYSVHIGEGEGDGVLGMYSLNGVELPVRMETCSVDRYVYWSEAERDAAYFLLDTVNEVIRAIEASAEFCG